LPTRDVSQEEMHTVTNYMIDIALSNRMVALRPAAARARVKMASSIAGVTRPVNVFCWLGW
jgi:hypothetical protein